MRALVIAVITLIAVAPASAARVGAADRAAVNRTLDAFVASAVKRQDIGASFDLVTSQLRGGVTRAAWAKGDIPVYPYPARGNHFHDWTVDYALPNDVAFELMLQPRDRKLNPISFAGEVKKIRGRWLLDSFYPVAMFDAKHSKVVGPNDFTAQRFAGDSGESRLGAAWFAIPGAFLGLIVLFPLGWLVYAWQRSRRAYRRHSRRPYTQRATQSQRL